MDSYGVACNISLPDKALRLNAKCLVVWHTGGGTSILVAGLSKGGRKIIKWIKIKKCNNFRPVFLLDKNTYPLAPSGSKEEMMKVAEYINRCK